MMGALVEKIVAALYWVFKQFIKVGRLAFVGIELFCQGFGFLAVKFTWLFYSTLFFGFSKVLDFTGLSLRVFTTLSSGLSSVAGHIVSSFGGLPDSGSALEVVWHWLDTCFYMINLELLLRHAANFLVITGTVWSLRRFLTFIHVIKR